MPGAVPAVLARPRFGIFAAAFCAGVIGAAALPWLVTPFAVALLTALAGLLAVWRRTRWIAAVVAGALWFSAHALWIQLQAWPESRAGEVVEFEARVAGLPVQRDGRARLLVAPDRVARRAGVPAKVLLSWYRPLEWFRPGQQWRLTVELTPSDGRVNPGLFDYQRWLVAAGIGAEGRIVAARQLDGEGWMQAGDRLRQRFADLLQAEIADLNAAALARALTVADRSALSPELSEQLRRTGTAHLLSISGLHVGMVAGLTGLLAGVVLTPLLSLGLIADRKRWMLAFGLLGAAGYTVLAGFSLPTVRALVMLIAGFGALFWRRSLQPGRALLLALLAVLLLDPLAPLAIGFWLSFMAVAVLIWAFAGRGARGRGWMSLVRAQFVVALGLLPLNLAIFVQWAPTALAANLVAIPLVAFWILPGLLLGLAHFLAGLPVEWIMWLVEHGLRVLLWLLEYFTNLDTGLEALARPARAPPSRTALVLAMIGALWLLAPRGWPIRPVGALLLLPLLVPRESALGHGEFELLVPDLGNGQAVVVRTRSQAWLYGAGPGDGVGASLVPGTIAPLLRQRGIRRPERVVVPFDHRDYAGGLASARAQWPGVPVMAGSAAADIGCTKGTNWRADGVEFRVLHPSTALPDLGADSSCVVEVSSPFGRVLLTGGIGELVQRRLARSASPAADVPTVLVLPRGGHRDALDEGWLARVAPHAAVATVARFHRAGLPHQSVREQLAARAIPFLTTGACGALTIRFGRRNPPEIQAELAVRPRFWQTAEQCPAAAFAVSPRRTGL